MEKWRSKSRAHLLPATDLLFKLFIIIAGVLLMWFSQFSVRLIANVKTYALDFVIIYQRFSAQDFFVLKDRSDVWWVKSLTFWNLANLFWFLLLRLNLRKNGRRALITNCYERNIILNRPVFHNLWCRRLIFRELIFDSSFFLPQIF